MLNCKQKSSAVQRGPFKCGARLAGQAEGDATGSPVTRQLLALLQFKGHARGIE